MTDLDLVCEVQRALALGWQGLADDPALVERIVHASPYMDPPVGEIVQAIYRAQQSGRPVVVNVTG